MRKQGAQKYYLVICFTAVVAFATGFYLGENRNSDSKDDGEVSALAVENEHVKIGAPAPEETLEKELSETPEPEGEGEAARAKVSPEQLAEQKGVPAIVSFPDGDYTLVAVIEGEEMNAELRRNLQLVTLQRERMNKLSREYEQTALDMTQQRELLAGQINQTRTTLEKNLDFMAKNYAFLISNNYQIVIYEATLSEINGAGEEQNKSVIHTFNNAESYLAFEKKFENYLKLKQEQSSKSQVTSGKESATVLPLTPAMKIIQSELIQLYKFDPEKKNLLEFQKAGLYARKGN